MTELIAWLCSKARPTNPYDRSVDGNQRRCRSAAHNDRTRRPVALEDSAARMEDCVNVSYRAIVRPLLVYLRRLRCRRILE